MFIKRMSLNMCLYSNIYYLKTYNYCYTLLFFIQTMFEFIYLICKTFLYSLSH